MPVLLPTPEEFAVMPRGKKMRVRAAVRAYGQTVGVRVRDYKPPSPEYGERVREDARRWAQAHPVDPNAVRQNRAKLAKIVGAPWPTDRKRTMDDVVTEFNQTRPRHGGLVAIAAPVLGMTPLALKRALYRARRAGFDVAMVDDTHRQEAA